MFCNRSLKKSLTCFYPIVLFIIAESNWRYVSFNTVLNMYFARNKAFEVKETNVKTLYHYNKKL